MPIQIKSTAFDHDSPIPKRHTEDGEDLSPALAWSGVPSGTKELALIMDDPDAPRPEPWVHWVLYKIPATTQGLPEGVPRDAKLKSPAGALQGKNTWGTVGYRGPAPPKGHGVHHYHWKLYALDKALELGPGADKAGLLAAIKGHELGMGVLIGTYERK